MKFFDALHANMKKPVAKSDTFLGNGRADFSQGVATKKVKPRGFSLPTFRGYK